MERNIARLAGEGRDWEAGFIGGRDGERVYVDLQMDGGGEVGRV